MKPIMKWPGGKSGEVAKIKDRFPAHSRFIEPFFGGGAVFFYLEPSSAMINDHSELLMSFYRLVKNQDSELYRYLTYYDHSFQTTHSFAKSCVQELSGLLKAHRNPHDASVKDQINGMVQSLVSELSLHDSQSLILDHDEFSSHLCRMVGDKLARTQANCAKGMIGGADIEDNLLTGFLSGYYMYYRKVMNDIALNRSAEISLPYKIANFYFIREYCYGSMFRYNAQGEFNIPYGGISYNKKNFRAKIDAIYNPDVGRLFGATEIDSKDFQEFLESVPLSNDDFVFLDPPYDSDFSDYEGNNFTRHDHERLAALLRRLPAKWMLVIKNTPFIRSLYGNDYHISSFDNTYTYNVRSRNQRNAEHLIITNY